MWSLGTPRPPDRTSDDVDPRPSSLWAQPNTELVTFGLSAAGLGALGFWLVLRARSHLKRIENAASLLPSHFDRRNGWVKGVVTSVGDADGFRLWHTPFPSFLHAPPKDKKRPSEGEISSLQRSLMSIPAGPNQTISIRIAGVDAPEMPHFGHPGQPFAIEAQDHLRKLVLGRRIWVQLLKRDRYERCIGAAFYRSWLLRWKSVQQELTRRGLAVVYEGSDAVYGELDPKEKLVAIEHKARAKKLGMWSQKAKAYESPAQYKRRTGG